MEGLQFWSFVPPNLVLFLLDRYEEVHTWWSSPSSFSVAPFWYEDTVAARLWRFVLSVYFLDLPWAHPGPRRIQNTNLQMGFNSAVPVHLALNLADVKLPLRETSQKLPISRSRRRQRWRQRWQRQRRQRRRNKIGWKNQIAV